MARSQLELKVKEIISPAIEEMGYRVVAVEMGQEGNMPLLQIMAEDPETGLISLDACADISREASALLDVEDPISSAYRLEVSSPGIDRPLFTVEDFEKYQGFETKLELDTPVDTGQKKFRGTVIGTKNNTVLFKADNTDYEFEIGNIAKAKLILTDELIKKTQKSA